MESTHRFIASKSINRESLFHLKHSTIPKNYPHHPNLIVHQPSYQSSPLDDTSFN